MLALSLLADRCHGHVDIELALIAADQQAAVGRSDTVIALQASIDWVVGRLARDLIEDTEYFGERAAPCRQVVPARQPLGDSVEIGNDGCCIRGDDSIPDAGQGDAEQLFLRSQDVVRPGELCGALLDFAFQVVIRATQRLFGALRLLHLPFQLPVDRLLVISRRRQVAHEISIVEAQPERLGDRPVVACRDQRHHRNEQDQHRAHGHEHFASLSHQLDRKRQDRRD